MIKNFSSHWNESADGVKEVNRLLPGQMQRASYADGQESLRREASFHVEGETSGLHLHPSPQSLSRWVSHDNEHHKLPHESEQFQSQRPTQTTSLNPEMPAWIIGDERRLMLYLIEGLAPGVPRSKFEELGIAERMGPGFTMNGC